jgi:ketosteroid isomerase-like protein
VVRGVLPACVYGAPVDQREATDFAARWERAWNDHDLDALLAHFAPDVVFSSPVAAQLLDGDGVIRGRDALRAYWSRALGLIPDLRFTVEGVYAGLDAVVINYRNHAGNLVCEYLTFGDDGLVVAGHATYQTDAAAAASGIDRA